MEMVNALGLEPVPRRVTWAASPMLSESASAAPQDSRVEEERASPTPSERPRRRTHPGSRPGAPAYRTRGLDSIEGVSERGTSESEERDDESEEHDDEGEEHD